LHTEPGQHFGELSLLQSDSTTAADVVAADETTTVLLLTPSSFRNICLTHEKFKGLLLASTPSYREYNFFFHLSAFRDAQHDFLLALVTVVRRITRDAGTTLQSLNETGNGGAYFVEKGQLLATAPGARPVALHEGSYFGLETLSSADAAAAPLQHVQAGTDVELLYLPREEAQQLMLSFPYLANVAQAQQLTLVSNTTTPRGAPSSQQVAGPVSVSQSSATSSELPLDLDLLTQRITLMQASIVAMGREMRSRIDSIDTSMAEKFERKDRHQSAALSQIHTRLNHLSAACEHPQRAARSTRVAFAPRGATSSQSSRCSFESAFEMADAQPMRTIVNAAASSRRSSIDSQAGC
jgi:CRP-like cAMP-binding protein